MNQVYRFVPFGGTFW
jgi:hypothetical protein